MIKAGFIGAGNMGSALAAAASKAEDVAVYIYDKDEKKAKSVADGLGAALASAESIAAECDYIFLAVKPNIISGVAESLKPALDGRKNAAVVSMAAGVSLEKLGAVLPRTPIIRIMPNTPAAYGKGMMLWCKNSLVSDAAAEGFVQTMAKSGTLDEIPEALIDAGSAVSGCGPAFVYMFIEALADGGVMCGLPRDKALLYACETLAGAAETVKRSGIHPEALKDAVCSPGGSTIEGVHALDKGGFRGTAASAVTAAFEKTKKLGK